MRGGREGWSEGGEGGGRGRGGREGRGGRGERGGGEGGRGGRGLREGGEVGGGREGVMTVIHILIGGVIPDIRYNYGDEMRRRKNSLTKITSTILLCSTYFSMSI